MTRTKYDICSCEEALALLDAIERAWCECPLGATRASAILREALDAHHANIIEHIEKG